MPTSIPTTQHPTLKSLINETYTDGVESIIDSRLEDDGTIIATARDEDRIVAFKYTDELVSVRILNPEVIEGTEEDEDNDVPQANADESLRTDKNCKKGLPCGNSCISRKKKCRKKLSGATLAKAKAAAKPKTAPKQQPKNVADRLDEALKANDFNEAAKVADEIYESAAKRALTAGQDFYDGIAAGNGSTEDWILKEIYAARGYDGKPKKVTKKVIDDAYKNDQVVGYRAIGSTDARFKQHFNNFKNGDYFAGHGIYGHGTYIAYAQRGGTHSRQTAVNAASPYGSGVMRIALKPGASIIDQSDHQADYVAMDTRLRNWRNSENPSQKAYRRLRRVTIGNGESLNDTSGRLAAIQGFDAIRLNNAYDTTYMNLLNRSAVSVQKTKGVLYKQ